MVKNAFKNAYAFLDTGTYIVANSAGNDKRAAEIHVNIKVPENYKKLFKSQFLLEAINNNNTFMKLINYMKDMELPAIINYYGDKYGQEVEDKLLKDPNGLVFYMIENPLEIYEECTIAKYIWKTVVDLTL